MNDSPISRKGRFDWLTLGSAIVTLALTVRMVSLGLGRLGFGPEPLPPTAQEVANYRWVAGIVIAIQVGLLVRAIVLRRGGLILISTAALIVAVGVALAFSVPPIDWHPDPATYTTDPDYVPCYSGSDDCPGG